MIQHSKHKPCYSMIAAMDSNNLIGKDNALPWRLPADMKWFVSNTTGKPVIMGRKTFDSLGGKPLKDRKNIIITRNPDFDSDVVEVANSIDQALTQAQPADEVMVIGGSSFYEQFLPKAHRLYITRVDGEFEGDSWFPSFDLSEWQLVFEEAHQADDRNPHDYTFCVYDPL